MVTEERLLQRMAIRLWVLLIAHAAAEWSHLYWVYRWLDIPMHFLGGAWLGISGVWFLQYSGWVRTYSSVAGVRTVIAALVAGVVVGIAWELYELMVWRIAGTGLPVDYLTDTMFDLFMDVLGSGCAGLILHVPFRTVASHDQYV